jgi:hypothetical protein
MEAHFSTEGAEANLTPTLPFMLLPNGATNESKASQDVNPKHSNHVCSASFASSFNGEKVGIGVG